MASSPSGSGFSWISNFPNAYEAYAPTGCSKTIGEAMVKISVDRLCRIFKKLKQDEECISMAKGL